MNNYIDNWLYETNSLIVTYKHDHDIRSNSYWWLGYPSKVRYMSKDRFIGFEYANGTKPQQLNSIYTIHIVNWNQYAL